MRPASLTVPLLSSVLLVSVLRPAVALYHKDVTAYNFDSLLDPSKANILVEFYAPWCGHCKALAPEFEKLGDSLASAADIVVAQVDADKHKKLARRFDIKGYPTLKWVSKGSSFSDAENVEAERTAEGLLSFINKKTGLSKKLKGALESSVTEITADNFDELSKQEGVHALIEFFAPWCGHCKALKPTWEDLARLYADDSDVLVGAVDCDAHKELCNTVGVQGFPTIKYFAPSSSSSSSVSDDDTAASSSPQDYDSGRTLDDLVTFVNTKTGHEHASDGGVIQGAGVIAEISTHVEEYVAASSDEERANAFNVCQEKVEGLGDSAMSKFKYYAKVFANIADKGTGYVETEKNRLSSVLENGSGGLKPAQKRSFLRRLNVLNVFAGKE